MENLENKLMYVKHKPPGKPGRLPEWMTATREDRLQADQFLLSRNLHLMRLQELRKIVKKRRLKLKGTTKDQVVEQLSRLLSCADDYSEIVAGLEPDLRRVLFAMIFLCDETYVNKLKLQQVCERWGVSGTGDEFFNYTKHLHEIGLVFLTESYDEFEHNSGIVPRLVARHIKPVLKDYIASTVDLKIGNKKFCDPCGLIHSVEQLILFIERSCVNLPASLPRLKIEKSTKGLKGWNYDPAEFLKLKQQVKPGKKSIDFLSVPTSPRSIPDEIIKFIMPPSGKEAHLEFILSLMNAAGLLQDGSPVLVRAKTRDAFFAHDVPVKRAILARTYFQLKDWNEMWEVLRKNSSIQLKRDMTYTYQEQEDLHKYLLAFRKVVLRVLAALPHNKWIQISDLLKLMQIVIPTFDSSTWESRRYFKDSYKWFITKKGSSEVLDFNVLANWNSVQGSFIRYIIEGPLFWLGLADLSYVRKDLKFFRLHDLGDLYYDRSEAPLSAQYTEISPHKKEAVTVVDTRIIMNSSNTDVRAYAFLDSIARLVRTEPECLMFQIDSSCVYKSCESGITVSKIMADWEQFLKIPMPENIRTCLTKWWESYGQIHIHQNITVIEFGDDYALAEMKAVTSLEKYLIAEFPPGLVVIPQNAVKSLRAELDKSGYSSVQTNEI